MLRLNSLPPSLLARGAAFTPSSSTLRLSARLPARHLCAYSSAPDAPPPFNKLLAANRGEIATRIMRASTELSIPTVGIFAYEDRFTQHRYKADQAFLVGAGKSPVGAYLDIDSIVSTCVENGVEAVHPGYGFLSENEEFARKLELNGIRFVGPTADNLATFGDKTAARELAIKLGVPVVPGTDDAVDNVADARMWIETGNAEKEPIGYPVIIKAAMGGGGRGMRVVNSAAELEDNFNMASSEALTAFGDGRCFIERYVDRPRHIEVQGLGDGTGAVVHLFDRDCSVQRRHQKVVETAPAHNLPEELREKLFADSVRLLSECKYKNAGTVEFLVDKQNRYYFIEVNPRIQVEHTVTEEVTGIDLVQSQIKIASGATLADLGLTQDKITCSGYAMQVRVTTEDPTDDFRPDTGTIDVFRMPGGMGIRLDDGPGFPGAKITPYFDSLLVKITARARERADAAKKLSRALKEFRVRGVTTNKSFLLNCLTNDEFMNGAVDTSFIGSNPDLLAPSTSKDRAQKLLKFIGSTIVNGPEPALGATGAPCSKVDPVVPNLGPNGVAASPSLRSIYAKDGPEAFAKAVRGKKELLLMDTTWRDAHQSLLATRVRTKDLLNVAQPTSVALANAYSLECWGGATFDVTMRFLRECPWDRLAQLREAVPDIPFQMLLRGANAVGYKSYPDNAVFEFCEMAQKTGMDVFRVFDSLNYVENMRLGIDAVGTAGGIVEASISYTGDVSDPNRGLYDLEYYLKLTDELKGLGIHVLNIKDMAGLLKPSAARMLVGGIREAHPDLPIHVHTHDTAGTGVASMIACAESGADAVDVATDAMSGVTSQPSMGAIVAALQGTDLDTGIDLEKINKINSYWEVMRGVYRPFESGQMAGSSDVYINEIPGGQYTNMLYQSKQLGLENEWPEVKTAYASANRLLGDIPKVTPSSKVVGDMAQFMVANKLTEDEVKAQASTLSFPTSVVEYFQGYLGVPPHGFPEPLRSDIIENRTIPGTDLRQFEGRPGAELKPFDFEAAKRNLVDKWGENNITDHDVMSHCMYPDVFDDFKTKVREFGKVDMLDTRTFVEGMEVGDGEIVVEMEKGKTLNLKCVAVSAPDAEGMVTVNFEMNGAARTVRVKDTNATSSIVTRSKADPSVLGQIGASMMGLVVETRVKKGDEVKAGDPLVVLSAMKMETMISSPVSGVVKFIEVTAGDNVKQGDLLIEIE
jgi:pyruvate carboxylase